MSFDKAVFYNNSKEIIKSLNKHINYLGDLQYMIANTNEQNLSFDDDEFIANSVITDTVKLLQLSIISATEQLELQTVRDMFQIEFKQFKDKESQIELLPWFDTSYSPVVELLERYINAITADVVNKTNDNPITTRNEANEDSIRKVLRNSGFLLNHMKIIPTSEDNIHKPIFAHLKILFPSAVSKYKIYKANKHYEVDIMIPDYKIGIELKFAKSENDVKNQIDELYIDMKGYEEDDPEMKYIALIYMDSQYTTDDVIKETLRQNNCPVNWEIITVINKISSKKTAAK